MVFCLTFGSRVTEVRPDGFVMERSKLVKGLYPGVKLDLYFPGFPTLKHLEHSVSGTIHYNVAIRCEMFALDLGMSEYKCVVNDGTVDLLT